MQFIIQSGPPLHMPATAFKNSCVGCKWSHSIYPPHGALLMRLFLQTQWSVPLIFLANSLWALALGIIKTINNVFNVD